MCAYKKYPQYLRLKNAATPARIHMFSGSLLANSMKSTKFVECPVVDSVPLLDTTLYIGQL